MPASLDEMILLELIRQSESVVFPWSTCARMQIFLILFGIC